jgi:DNA processing protein
LEGVPDPEPLAPRHLTPLDRDYPSRLRRMARPPATITVQGGTLDAPMTVALVGSREAHPDAAEFARLLASSLAASGAAVVSGGATGIDAAAHRGALGAGGRTWCVAGTGSDHCYPSGHETLFAAIARGPGLMLWPFPQSTVARPASFLARNHVLVALSDVVVVVQAGARSGALHAAACALRLGRTLWVAATAPWLGPEFDGSRRLLAQGARPLLDEGALFRSLGLGSTMAASRPNDEESRVLSPSEDAVFRAVSTMPLHLDTIAARAGAPPQVAGVALLTLALENVVVEGPPGFYRRRNTSSDRR